MLSKTSLTSIHDQPNDKLAQANSLRISFVVDIRKLSVGVFFANGKPKTNFLSWGLIYHSLALLWWCFKVLFVIVVTYIEQKEEEKLDSFFLLWKNQKENFVLFESE